MYQLVQRLTAKEPCRSEVSERFGHSIYYIILIMRLTEREIFAPLQSLTQRVAGAAHGAQRVARATLAQSFA